MIVFSREGPGKEEGIVMVLMTDGDKRNCSYRKFGLRAWQ